MKKSIIVTVLSVVILSAGFAFASTKVGEITSPQGETYDKIKVTGEVTEVSDQPRVVMIKDADDGTVYDVRLGPPWYKEINVKEGDTITVEGVSHNKTDEGLNKLATFKITQANGEEVIIREQLGKPAWAGTKGQGNGANGESQRRHMNKSGDGGCQSTSE